MNIQFETKSYQTGAEMIEEARARHRRFEQAGRLVLVKKVDLIPEVHKPFMAQQIPQWKLGKMHFDAHVVEWGMRHANPALAYLKDRCAELDILFRHIIGPGRRYAVVEIRHLLMWEIYEKFDLSLPQIGRLFGGRDHTTVLYAVNKIEARMSEARA
jgi:hypothetical protein